MSEDPDLFCYKMLFLTKKQTVSLHRQYSTKKLPLTISRKLQLGLLYELGDQAKVGKIASKKVSSLASWIA